MAQVDWLSEVELSGGESVVSVVTSGDIDSVAIHLFAVSKHWKRRDDGKFMNSVFVLLQKPKPDLYNITGMLELMEDHFKQLSVGVAVSVSLCLGGNDFLPKFTGIPHKKWIESLLSLPGGLTSILKSGNGEEQIDEDLYLQVVKTLYCPSTLDVNKMTFEDIRQLSIKLPGKDYHRNPNLWMPPKTALLQLSKLINCQIQYLMTTWNYSAELPNFLDSGCLRNLCSGDIEYNLGPDSHCDEVSSILLKTNQQMLEAMKAARPARAKRPCPETPDKQAKKRPLVSTPRKKRTLIPVEQLTEDLSGIEPIQGSLSDY